jgi:hypothetical protein
MDTICIRPEADYQGEGISTGLARGLLVYYGDCNLTGEGMGIGSIALRDPSCTYFSRTWTDTAEPGLLRRTFILDTRMMWGIWQKPSTVLTRWIESGISAYMKLPRLQGILMLPVLPLRALLGIHPVFETISPRGKVTFTYHVTGQTVEIQIESQMPLGPGETLCLLNELSAAWFTSGWDGKQKVPPPPGWEKVGSDQLPVCLLDPVHGIRFFLDQPSVSPSVPYTIFRGREQSEDLCWAGFCIELGPPDRMQESVGARYSIGFRQEAGP